MLFFGRKKRLIDYASCAGCAGKLAPQGLAEVMRFRSPASDANLLVGTETGDDAGVYRISNDTALVQTIDFFPPVVNDPFLYGQIAAANAISDVFAMGGTPKTALNLICYPGDKLNFDWLGEIVRGGEERCAAAKVVVLGGHTLRDAEIKFGYAVTGVIHPEHILTNAKAQPGDKLVLTKPLGTGFVTTAHRAEACPDDVFQAACASMTQLNDIGRDAMLEAGAHSATDVTGFGLAGHGYGMAKGSGVTLVFEISRLPLIEGAEKLARKPYLTRASGTNAAYVASELRVEGKPDATALEFFYDAQTSGGLLISVPADRADMLVENARKKGAAATAVIGEVIERADVALIVRP
jgi:selenide,water dikinase